MSPVAKNNWSKGFIITWRTAGIVFFIYFYSYTQERKATDLAIKNKQDSILSNQLWEKYQIQSALDYRITDNEQHIKMLDRLDTDESNIAEIKGYLHLRLAGIQ